MVDTLKSSPVSDRDLHYYRSRYKNRVFAALVGFYAAEAERIGVNQTTLAKRLGKDAAQINRWLKAPSNLTLESISDLLLALDAEMDQNVVCFEERGKPNASHPFATRLTALKTPLKPNRDNKIKEGGATFVLVGKAATITSGSRLSKAVVAATT